jgi:hypothetical protein
MKPPLVAKMLVALGPSAPSLGVISILTPFFAEDCKSRQREPFIVSRRYEDGSL